MKNSIISIQGTPVRLLVDTFDVYEQHDAYLATSVEDDAPSFIDWLATVGLVELGIDHNGVINTDESYLLWSLAPTADEMRALREILSLDDYQQIKPYHLEILATGYRLDNGPITDHVEYLAWLADESQPDHLVNCLMTLLTHAMQTQQRDHIERIGWSIMNIVPDSETPDLPSYCYTVGLSLKTGYELILINGADGGPETLNWLAERLTDPLQETPLDTPITVDDIRVNGHPLRLQVVDLDSDSPAFCAVVTGLPDVEVTAVKQVLIPDHNGILPGEEGYDETLIQELSHG